MRGARMLGILVFVAAASTAHAQDAVEWFQKAVYTTNVDEQIHYYQKALEVDPGYHQAQHNLAAVYYRKGLIRKSIAMYEALIRGGHAYYQTFYDLACCYARVGDTEHSLKALTRAFQKGFHDKKLVSRDEDLASVRALPQYQRLAAHYLQGQPLPPAPHIEAAPVVAAAPKKMHAKQPKAAGPQLAAAPKKLKKAKAAKPTGAAKPAAAPTAAAEPLNAGLVVKK